MDTQLGSGGSGLFSEMNRSECNSHTLKLITFLINWSRLYSKWISTYASNWLRYFILYRLAFYTVTLARSSTALITNNFLVSTQM